MIKVGNGVRFGACVSVIVFGCVGAAPSYAEAPSTTSSIAAQRRAENERAAQEAAARAQEEQDRVLAEHDKKTKQWERQQRRKDNAPTVDDHPATGGGITGAGDIGGPGGY